LENWEDVNESSSNTGMMSLRVRGRLGLIQVVTLICWCFKDWPLIGVSKPMQVRLMRCFWIKEETLMFSKRDFFWVAWFASRVVVYLCVLTVLEFKGRFWNEGLPKNL